MDSNGFWESPESRTPGTDYRCGKAKADLCEKPQTSDWDPVAAALRKLIPCSCREELDFGFSEDKKYSYEEAKRSDSSGVFPRVQPKLMHCA